MMNEVERNEKAEVVLEAIEEVISNGSVINDIFLKNGQFRSAPRKNGSSLGKYLHRLIQFNTGINPHMPVTNTFNLQDFCDEVLHQDHMNSKNSFSVYLTNGKVKDIYNRLDNYCEELCKSHNLNYNRILYIWKNALGY